MEENEKVPQEGTEVAAEAPAVEETVTVTEEIIGNITVVDPIEIANKEPIVEEVKITPAEESKKLKENKAKLNEAKGNENKAVEAIIKSSLYSKVFSPGTFPGNSVSAHIEFAKEAAAHLVSNNDWNIDSKTLDDGSVIQFIGK